MKKFRLLLTIFSFMLILGACGNESEESTNSTETETPAEPIYVAKDDELNSETVQAIWERDYYTTLFEDMDDSLIYFNSQDNQLELTAFEVTWIDQLEDTAYVEANIEFTNEFCTQNHEARFQLTFDEERGWFMSYVEDIALVSCYPVTPTLEIIEPLIKDFVFNRMTDFQVVDIQPTDFVEGSDSLTSNDPVSEVVLKNSETGEEMMWLFQMDFNEDAGVWEVVDSHLPDNNVATS